MCFLEKGIGVVNSQLPALPGTLVPSGPQEVQNNSHGKVQLQFPRKTVMIGGTQYSVNAEQLMSMIRSITQQIGHYKNNETDPFAAYMLLGLRQARTAMANSLASSFGISMRIVNGSSVFSL